MKNKLSDLNNILFEQLERLMDDEKTDEEFAKEQARAKAVTDVAGKVIDNARLTLDAYKFAEEYGSGAHVPALLLGE